MTQLNQNELKVKKIIVQFLKDNNVYAQFIKEFNKGYKTYVNIYQYISEEITDYSFNGFVKRIYKGEDIDGVLFEAFIWDETENEELWINLRDKDMELLNTIQTMTFNKIYS